MTAPQFTPTPGPWYQVGECRTVHADKSLCTSGSIDHSLNCRARYGGECCCGKRALTNQINTALAKARGEEVTA